ncbi:MAG: Enoyl-CoA hydratase/isomerase [Ilumatobacteraceae bacterium]|nr:Enoyl-CoA hydratase/isomerase [Ilumatobacteraceae bacterium]
MSVSIEPRRWPVLVEQHGAVTVVTIDRPEAGNALDPDAMAGLGAAFHAAEQDDDVRVVVLAAAGERVFCAGMDLKSFAGGRRQTAGDGPGLEVFLRRLYPKPIVAAVNGAAVAGGFELLMAADVIVAAEHARFGLPEVKRGLVAAGGATSLPRRIPPAIALELGLTGDLIDASRALQLGLINRIVPKNEALAGALDIAHRIAANGPLAVTTTKRLMVEEMGSIDWDHIREESSTVFASADAIEGARAFAEKRPAVFTGR